MWVVSVLSALLVALQVYLLYRQMKIASEQLEKNNDWNRIQATISIIGRYNTLINQTNDQLLEEVKLITLQNKELSVSETSKVLDSLPNRKQLFLFCDFYEELALGIKFKYLNEDIVYEQLYASLIRNFDNLYGYIHIRRIETKINICGNFEWLALRWKRRANKELMGENNEEIDN